MTNLLKNDTFKTYFTVSNGSGTTATDDEISNATYIEFYKNNDNNIDTCELDFTGSVEAKEFKIDKILQSDGADSGTLILKGDDKSMIIFDGQNSGCSMSSSSGIIYFKSGTYKFINNAIFHLLNVTSSDGYYMFEDDTILDFSGANFILKSLDLIIINYKVNNTDTQNKILEYIYYLKQTVFNNSTTINDLTNKNNELTNKNNELTNANNDLTDKNGELTSENNNLSSTSIQLRKLICALVYPVSKGAAYPIDGIN